MSDYGYDDNDDDLEDAQGESGAMRDLRKAYKSAQKQNKELADKLNQMQSSLRERSVKDVLASKGLPEKIAKFIPSEATSAEDVEAWLNENGDVFGSATPATGEQPQDVNPDLAAWGRISATQSSGQPFTNDPDQLQSLIKAASNPEDLNKLLFGHASGPQAV
jgi:hypothetical protein